MKNDNKKKPVEKAGKQIDREEWIARAVAAAAMNPAKRKPSGSPKRRDGKD